MAWLLHQLGHTLQLTPQDQDLSTVNSLGGSRSGNVLGLAIDCMLQWPVNIKKSKSNRRDYVAHLFGYFFIFFLLILNKNDLNEKHVRTHRHFVNHRDAHGCTLGGEPHPWIDGRTSSSLMFFVEKLRVGRSYCASSWAHFFLFWKDPLDSKSDLLDYMHPYIIF